MQNKQSISKILYYGHFITYKLLHFPILKISPQPNTSQGKDFFQQTTIHLSYFQRNDLKKNLVLCRNQSSCNHNKNFLKTKSLSLRNITSPNHKNTVKTSRKKASKQNMPNNPPPINTVRKNTLKLIDKLSRDSDIPSERSQKRAKVFSGNRFSNLTDST